MTLEQAKHILLTYKLPMSSQEMRLYKEALDMVLKQTLKHPGT